jgi:hypothetical protein
MVDDTLRTLHQAEEVAFRTDGGEVDRFELTRKGERTAASLERIRPEQATIPLYFDGLTRKPIEPPIEALLSGKQPEDLGIKEIPALPPARIEVGDIDVTEAARLLGKERNEGRRDLLAIKSIERRMRLHRPVTALVFQSADGGEVELLFASEGQMLDEHNRAFALVEGPRKTRLLAEFAKADQVGTDAFARRLTQLDKSIDRPKAAGKGRTLSPKKILPEGTIVRLNVEDHAPLLDEALTTAQRRLMIFSPWITSLVVDPQRILMIRRLLERGVRLHIGYGLDEEAKPKGKPKIRLVPSELQKLANEFPNFELRRFGNTHEKILIKDDDYFVLTSFNWLSFRGDASRTFRRERGVKISEPAHIEKEYAALEATFRAKARRKKLEEE